MGVLTGVVMGFRAMLTGESSTGLIDGIVFGLVFGLQFGAILVIGFGLVGVLYGLSTTEIETRTAPGQGTWQSLKNAVVVGLPFGLLGGLMFGLFSGYVFGLQVGWWGGLLGGLLSGLATGLRYGGSVVIYHSTLRFMLYRNSDIPWHYVRFLDYATERIFLRKVGGGYIFIHRLLQEYLAGLELETLKR